MRAEATESHQRGEVEKGDEIGDARVGGKAFLFAEFQLSGKDFRAAGIDAGWPERRAGEIDKRRDFAGFRFALQVEEGDEGLVHRGASRGRKRRCQFFMPERVRKRGRDGKRKVFPRWMADERRETCGRGNLQKCQ